MEQFLQQHPGVAMAIIGGLAWVIGKSICVVAPALWKRADNTGLATKGELEDAAKRFREAEASCQQAVAKELSEIKKALTDGDGWFAGLREGQSDLAVTVRDLCKALKPILGGEDVDCDRLLKWITGRAENKRT